MPFNRPGQPQPSRQSKQQAADANRKNKGRSRPPKKKIKPWVRRAVIGIQLFSLVFLLSVISVLGMLIFFYMTMPSAESQLKDYHPPGNATIYSSDGVLLANIFQQNRKLTTIDHMPKDMQNATVAIEDRRFYSNSGIDFRGIGRALVRDFQHGQSKEGASTITQQLVRNIGIGGVGHEKTLSRKIKEALYAIQIERNFSKQQILEMYLNQVYYGSGAYGIESAAETYFNKTSDKLSLSESATLAGLPKAPSYYSPYLNMDAARNRRDTVLEEMREQNYISDEQYTAATSEPIKLGFAKSPQGKSKILHAPYFIDYVINQVNKNFGAGFLYQGGISITTTLNWAMQSKAEDAVKSGVESAKYRGATQAALVAMDAKTGFIVSMVGGVDYSKSQFNIAADGRRQPGSSFKPIVYTAAINDGVITEYTTIRDAPVTFPGANGAKWQPRDDDHRWHGNPTAKRALADSINIPAIKVLKQIGVDDAIHYANLMGVHSPLAPYLPLALGASAVTPLEMACVYSTIASDGQRPTPQCIKTITDEQGNSLYSSTPMLETTSIKKSTIDQIKDMLHAVTTEGTARALLGDGSVPEACGKTGTTQNHYDVWFDGFSKDLVCVVWAGHPSHDQSGHAIMIPMKGDAFGGTICLPIWKSFMLTAGPILKKEHEKETVKPVIKPSPDQAEPQDHDSDNSSDDDSDTQDNQDTDHPTVAPSPNTEDQPSGSADQQSEPNSPDNSSPPPQNSTNASTTKTVTVTICTDSGLLANRWCPSTITKTFPAGSEPRRTCTIHKPPPGEQ
jgi:penicillin-binding protein 1A